MCEIILGTYEEFLLGYNYNSNKPSDSKQTFALHSHAGSVRSVAVSGKLLASGGADDRIVVYNLKDRRELCMLTHHNATINCLQFTKDHTHLISGSQDGVLSIVRVGNWQLEKVWDKAHKGSPIIDLAIHSSGKMMLTLGSDCSLRTWNLIKGRQAFAVNLNSKCKDPRSLQQIRWSPGGVLFSLMGGKYTDIWSIETGGIVKSIEHGEKVNSCEWITDEKLIAGYETGKVAFFNVTGNIDDAKECHKSRVKVMKIHEDYIVTGASDGEIKVWNKSTMESLTKFDSGCRFTCICISEVKLKQELEETSEDDNVVVLTSESKTKQRKVPVVEIEEESEEIEIPQPKKNNKQYVEITQETTRRRKKNKKNKNSAIVAEEPSEKKKKKRKSGADEWNVE